MNREQCKGCRYFRGEGFAAYDAMNYCHHYLETGVRRKIGENEVCLSRVQRKRQITIKKEKGKEKI